MKLTNRRLLAIVICGFLFLADRFLKWQALYGWAENHLVNRWFGWQPFFNPGVAFGVPLPNWVIIIFTVPIILLILAVFLNQELRIKNQGTMANDGSLIHNSYFLILIFAGALSNLLDRLAYGFTVDYFRIFTGVINLSDVMIMAGFVIYFVYSRKSVKS